MKKSVALLLLLNIVNTPTFAQEMKVSGKVVDPNGIGLPGVNIMIRGTTTGAVSNLDGNYNITAPGSDAVIVFSYVGFLTQEIGVGNQTSINVTLQEDVLGLEEVVVIGYGTQRKIDLTGSVATLSAEDIAAVPTPNFEEGMQGKVPGMEMKKTSHEPGGGISVIIRGTNSLLANNEPLYVIDGIPIVNDNRERLGGWEGQQALNTFSNLNPADIESIQVLKDASATAIYGSRAANGVIIISTRKGKSGKAMVDFEYSHTWSKAKAPYELCGVEDYARIENEYIANTGGVDFRYAADNDYGIPNATPEELGASYGMGTNWFDHILQTGNVNNYNLSIQGGDERSNYLISANYYDETGVVIGSDYRRGTLRANINSQVSKRLKTGINISGSRYDSERFRQTGRLTGGGPDRLGTITEAFRANPMTQLDTPHLSQDPLLQHAPGSGHVTNFVYHPVKQVENTDNSDAQNFLLASMNLDYNIIDGLNLLFRGGVNFVNQERINFQPMSVPVGNWYSAIGNHWFYDRRNYVFENYLKFNRSFGDHSLDATVGYSLEYQRIQNKSQRGDSFNFDLQGIYGWPQLVNPQSMNISETQRNLASIYGRVFYNFKNRYLFTITARQDGSSVFAKNKKWAFFPSGAVAWVISEESFMESTTWLTNLKLRGSYGLTGNQAIAPYQSLATVRSAGYHEWEPGYAFAGSKTSGLVPNTPANPDLRWETTKQINVGLDASFLDNRIQFSADYYKKNTIDLVQYKPVVATTGYETFTTNFGELSNTGVELMIGGTIFTSPIQWSSSLTWSLNRGKVEDLGMDALGNPLEIALPPYNQIAHWELITMFVIGEPVGTFYGYEWTGLLQQSDVDGGIPVVPGLNEAGDMKFLDYNGDGEISPDDMHPIGNAEPTFIAGWDNTLTYKNFSLNFFFNAVVGSKMLNLIKQYTHLGNIRNDGGRHSQEYADNYWTPTRIDAKYPRPGGGSVAITTFFLEDNSFLRLQTLTLNYQISTVQLGWNWIRNASIYARGTNVFVITYYTGFDPESQFQGQADYNQNIDLGSYPRPRSFELGVKLGF